MSVLLAAQIFSNTFADAMLFYKQREVAILKNADVTISFIRHINALFDALNRRLPQEGIRHDSNDLKVIEESLEWLNRWEAFRLQIRSTDQKGFLSHQTAENLRLTLTSILALVRQLLPNSYYILTAHFNQDPLERFFGMIRQGSGSNSHPTTVHFLYLYRLMTVYSLVRPPKRASVQTDPESILITLKNLLHSHKKPFNRAE
ncbi:uncharacterized protein LOC111636987 [Centruroides sculpturatus]|uniref:uncharacterized protein LOC111636987 n=1 Tax=Centruroides sculpturatus TaxID=218467 RepID=UPI000C6CB8A1|nr:uncharacterized protein LOC111636987 [Centruroides sculpturatus]